MSRMFACISNGDIDTNTNELTSVEYVYEYIYTQYLHTFEEVVSSKGLILVNHMNAVETSAGFK